MIDLTPKEKKFLVACFKEANGEPVGPLPIGQKLGFTKKWTEITVSSMRGRELFSLYSEGARVAFTVEGQRVALHLIDEEEHAAEGRKDVHQIVTQNQCAAVQDADETPHVDPRDKHPAPVAYTSSKSFSEQAEDLLDWIYQTFKETGKDVQLSEYPEIAKSMPRELLTRLTKHLENDNYRFFIKQTRQEMLSVDPPVWETFVEPYPEGISRVESRRHYQVVREGDHFLEWLYDESDGAARDVDALRYLQKVPGLPKDKLLSVLEDLARERRFIEFRAVLGCSLNGDLATSPTDGEPVRMTNNGITFVEKNRAKGRQNLTVNQKQGPVPSGNSALTQTFNVTGNVNVIGNATNSLIHSTLNTSPPERAKGNWPQKVIVTASVLILLFAVAIFGPQIANKPFLDFWNQNFWAGFASTVAGGLLLVFILWLISGKQEA